MVEKRKEIRIVSRLLDYMLDVGTIIAHVFLFVSLYFEIFLLVTFLEKRRELKESSGEPSYLPTATIVVPCWNEGKTLVKTVESLLGLDYPKEKLSILIVDDGSTDNTWEVMQQFKNTPNVRLIQKENGGKFTALNLGIAESHSEIIGCLDADSHVDTQALKRIAKRFENKEVQAVTPAILVNNPKNIIERIQSAEYAFSAFIRKTFSYIGAIYITPGPFSFFRRDIFEKIGPYRHAHNTEDLEIALRLQSKHFKIDNAHNAYVYTKAPRTPRALYKQRVRWIHGFLENARDYHFLFFKPRYGNLSMFVLPTATLSIFTALYFAFFAIWNMGLFVSNKIVEFSAVGINLTLQTPQFDWFFLRSESIFILSMILALLTISLILTGKYIVDRQVRFSRDIVYFVLFYSFLAPFWLARSVYNTAFSRKTSWR